MIVLVAEREHSEQGMDVAEEFQCPDLVEPEVVPGRGEPHESGDRDDGDEGRSGEA